MITKIAAVANVLVLMCLFIALEQHKKKQKKSQTW